MLKRIILLFSILVIGYGCDNAKFLGKSSQSNKKTVNHPSPTQPATQPGINKTQTINQNNNSPDQPITPVNILEENCPKNPQTILIMDMKSGWWSGVGGEFFQTVTKDLTLSCNGTITIKYHHVTKLGDVANPSTSGDGLGFDFLNEDWSFYTQIWVLSGAEDDSTDLQPGDPDLKKIQDKVLASSARLYIASGLGAFIHARVFSSDLGFANLFNSAKDMSSLIVSSDLSPMMAVSYLEKGKNFWDHPLFGRGITRIANNVDDTGSSSSLLSDEPGDFLNDHPNVETVAKYNDGKGAIGISKTGRKAVFDTGVQRFYVITSPNEKDTLTFLQNIILFLAN